MNPFRMNELLANMYHTDYESTLNINTYALCFEEFILVTPVEFNLYVYCAVDLKMHRQTQSSTVLAIRTAIE